MSTDYEPTGEQMDALHQRWRGLGYEEIKRDCLRRQHERERQIKQAREQARDDIEHGRFALACKLLTYAIDQLDAPKVPTLLEAAKAAVAPTQMGNAEEWIAVPKGDWHALKAAVERAEKDAKK